ncbi:DUF397 domain-containing protein [Micromonospora sp. NPDC005220]|uniref:DUF397 domain-containing protein n=1 Tax=Micromonospora sp. NPDC005220 TaxID=3155589 RepID=UPI0033A3B683
MDLTNAIWRKSRRSGSSGGNCVEVADNLPYIVGVRDSKDPAGPALTFGPTAWRAFVAQVAERP